MRRCFGGNRQSTMARSSAVCAAAVTASNASAQEIRKRRAMADYSWQLTVGSWQLTVGSWQLAVGSWQLAVGSESAHCQPPTANSERFGYVELHGAEVLVR